jgi:oligopeptide/dipeptide ABC transporter ATP-binding protein
VSETGAPLLRVRELSVSVGSPRGRLRLLDGVSLDVDRERSVALVGESGSGKTLTALAVLGLLPAGARIDSGSAELQGVELVGASDEAMQEIRGAKIGMVFQEPATAFDPVYTIGAHLEEAVRLHRDVSKREARAIAAEWLRRVGMPAPEEMLPRYPHELSGGMRQRAMIAMALVCDPLLLIADEPTTALDRTIEAQVLDLVAGLVEEKKMGLLLITHDLAVVGEVADRVVVLYAGQVVESGATEAILAGPLHPYTRALLDAIPDPAARTPRARGEKGARLRVLEGAPPEPGGGGAGCPFAPRCVDRMSRCEEQAPPSFDVGTDRAVRCFLHERAETARSSSA